MRMLRLLRVKGEPMFKTRFIIISLIGLAIISLTSLASAQSAEMVEKLFDKLDWRSVGPANMGGRTVDIDMVEKTPWIIYAAIGPSGVWKSSNNGITWRPIFHKENTVEGKEIKPTGVGIGSLPLVFPGEYEIELKVGEEISVGKGIINPDPRFSFSREGRAAQQETQIEIMILAKKMGRSVTGVKNIRRQLDKLNKDLTKKSDITDQVHAALQSFKTKFNELEDAINPDILGYRISMEKALRSGPIGGYPSIPTQAQSFHLDEVSEEMESLVERLNTFITKNIPSLNSILETSQIKPIMAPKTVDF